MEGVLERTNKIPNGCWEFLGAKRSGYGVVKRDGKCVATHRLSYEYHIGKIPKGLFVCHHCDNPKCVNPEHLFTGTRSDNMKDAFDKGRLNMPTNSYFKKGCKSHNRQYSSDFIRKLKVAVSNRKPDGKKLIEIAKEFSVPYHVIMSIRHKKTYYN